MGVLLPSSVQTMWKEVGSLYGVYILYEHYAAFALLALRSGTYCREAGVQIWSVLSLKRSEMTWQIYCRKLRVM